MTRLAPHTPEEQFALLLDGELSADEVGEDVRSLYALATRVEEHTELVRPEHGFRAELREQLVTAAAGQSATAWDRVRDAVWFHTARIRNSLRTAIASGTAASLIGTAGIAAASQHALPGELLYPAKELIESVRLSLAGDLAASGRLQLRFAEERLDEVQLGATDLRADLLIATLREMDEASIDGAEDLLGWATRTGDESVYDELHAFVESQRAGLLAVMDRLPSAVVPFAEESLEILRRVEVEAAGGTEPCDCPASSSHPGTEPVIRTPGDEPAGTPPAPCVCAPATDDPGPVREPAPEPPPTDTQPDPEPGDDPQPDPGDDDEPADVIPELPGPLDPLGDAVDDAVNDILDGADPVTDPLPVDPEDDVVAPIDETIDDLVGDLLGDL